MKNGKIYLMIAVLTALIVLLKSKKQSPVPGIPLEAFSRTKPYLTPDILVAQNPTVYAPDTIIRPLEFKGSFYGV